MIITVNKSEADMLKYQCAVKGFKCYILPIFGESGLVKAEIMHPNIVLPNGTDLTGEEGWTLRESVTRLTGLPTTTF